MDETNLTQYSALKLAAAIRAKKISPVEALDATLSQMDAVNGKVNAENLSADVEAMTVNGSVNVSTTGLARAHTVNGSITASMGRADWEGEMEFKTVNGGIDVTFPAGLSAEVEAKTLNGEITSDFPLTVQGTFSRRHLNGTVGGGGRELRLETVNGSVQIRRAS